MIVISNETREVKIYNDFSSKVLVNEIMKDAFVDNEVMAFSLNGDVHLFFCPEIEKTLDNIVLILKDISGDVLGVLSDKDITIHGTVVICSIKDGKVDLLGEEDINYFNEVVRICELGNTEGEMCGKQTYVVPIQAQQ